MSRYVDEYTGMNPVNHIHGNKSNVQLFEPMDGSKNENQYMYCCLHTLYMLSLNATIVPFTRLPNPNKQRFRWICCC